MLCASLVAFLVCVPVQDAAIEGSVSLQGDVPARKRFNAPTEREKSAFPDGIFYEPVVVDPEKHIRFAIVYVKAGLEGKTFPVPAEAKSLEVEAFQLRPRVLGIMAGQELVVTNRDGGVLHAVHALPWENKEFNTGLPGKGMSFKASFAKPEVAIRVKTECLHEWERAWVVVLPHPFHGVTDEKGRYEIRGLPPGKYTLEAWQENCPPAVREIEIKADERRTVDFSLEARVRAHLHISGRVQGVGFRASTVAEARRLEGITGWVRNLADGRVEAVIQGPREKVDALVKWCRTGPSSAEVTGVQRSDEPLFEDFRSFDVRN